MASGAVGRGVLIMAAVAIGFPACSSWATQPPSAAPSVAAVIACRRITDDAARLACFDKAVTAMDEAQTTGNLVTLDREQRRAVRRQTFGFQLPSLNIFDKGEKPEEADRLEAKVASARQDAFGKWSIRLEDGATWVQIDDSELRRTPKPGSSVVITRGLVGSFFLKVEGAGSMRARRIG